MTEPIPMNLKMEWRVAQDADSIETRALDALLASHALLAVLRQENLKLKMDVQMLQAEKSVLQKLVEERREEPTQTPKPAKKPKPRRMRRAG